MQIPVKVLMAKLEAEKIDKWEGKLLLWVLEYSQLESDHDLTHVKWDSPIDSDRGIYSARKILVANKKRCYSRKHKQAFYVFNIEDLRI